MSKVVRCMCEECVYNDDFQCKADGIEIYSSGDKKVETADGTRCQTFALKNLK